MANVTINMPNAEKARIDDGFALDNNYEGTKLVDETKAEFLERKILEYVINAFVNGEASAAGKTARETAETSAKDVKITIS